jgi:hypothetical protein
VRAIEVHGGLKTVNGYQKGMCTSRSLVGVLIDEDVGGSMSLLTAKLNLIAPSVVMEKTMSVVCTALGSEFPALCSILSYPTCESRKALGGAGQHTTRVP